MGESDIVLHRAPQFCLLVGVHTVCLLSYVQIGLGVTPILVDVRDNVIYPVRLLQWYFTTILMMLLTYNLTKLPRGKYCSILICLVSLHKPICP